MKARIIKFIEGERPSRQYIVVGAARRDSSGSSIKGQKEMTRENEHERATRERKSKGNNELIVRVMELTGNRTNASFNYGK